MKKINLVLAGGGLKSFAHFAIIEKLEMENIHINALSGTSMGSFIAALIACGCDSKTLKKEMLEMEQFFIDKKLFRKPSHKILPFATEKIEGGYIDGIIVEKELERRFLKYDVQSIKDVKIPIAIPSVDLTTGKLVVFVSNKDDFDVYDDSILIDDVSLALAVRASASVPFVFSSVEYQDYRLVDGGVRLNVPVPLLSKFKDVETLAITSKKKVEPLDSTSMFSLAMQVYQINSSEFDLHLGRLADFHINIPLGPLQFSLGKGQEIIEFGYHYLDENRLFEEMNKALGLL